MPNWIIWIDKNDKWHSTNKAGLDLRVFNMGTNKHISNARIAIEVDTENRSQALHKVKRAYESSLILQKGYSVASKG